MPDRGDVVWLQYGPNVGHEQAGHRPALVVSSRVYNAPSGLALFCPLTTRVKGYPYEVALPEGGTAVGAVLVDQIRNFDWRVRQMRKFDEVPRAVMDDVLAKLATLVAPA